MNKPTNQDNIQAWSNFSRELIDAFGDEGDPSHRYILNPGLFELVGNVANQTILEAGCGTGYLCRLFANQGAQVTGIEPTIIDEGVAVLGENNRNMHVPNFIIISARKH